MKTTKTPRVRASKPTRRTTGKKPRTRLEKLRAATDLQIEGPIGQVIEYAYNCEVLRSRKGKGRAK